MSGISDMGAPLNKTASMSKIYTYPRVEACRPPIACSIALRNASCSSDNIPKQETLD